MRLMSHHLLINRIFTSISPAISGRLCHAVMSREQCRVLDIIDLSPATALSKRESRSCWLWLKNLRQPAEFAFRSLSSTSQPKTDRPP